MSLPEHPSGCISATYLFRLCESYSHFFYHYDASPLLTVNTENLNPVKHDQDFELLPRRMCNMCRKREFFKLGE